MYRTILITVFWTCLALVFYVYVGYPIVIFVASRLFKISTRVDDAVQPTVTLLISAYNEASVIKQKIENSLALDYPKSCFEIIVISDGSEDGTDEIVGAYENKHVRLLRQRRLGKSIGLNSGIASSSGDIVIFSDANAIYEGAAVRKLVRHFADPTVGYVVGRATYVACPDKSAAAASEGLYWSFETALKHWESEFGAVPGGDGAIYAIRRNLFSPLLATDINDFLNPLQIVARGYRGVYEPEAVCFEHAGDSFEKEFRRKVRIVSRSTNAIRREPRVLLPWVQPRHWFALISHKVLRWCVPVFLLAALLSSAALLELRIFLTFCSVQTVFYCVAIAGYFGKDKARGPAYLLLPYYFCVVNLASLFGIFKFLSGTLSPTWETVRASEPAADSRRGRLARKGS